MVIYELKKVLFKNSSKAALIFLGAVLIFVIHMAVSGIRYVDDEGITHTGIWAAQQLREVKAPWEGPLTTQRLAQVIETNQKENATPEALSEDISQQNISYSRKQGYSDILTLMSDIFGSFDTFDYFVSDGLTVEDADDFYTQRVERLRQWLDGPAGDKYTQKEKEYFIRQFEAVKEPLYYEAADGWDQLFYLFPSLISVAALVMGFLVSGIFSCEKQWKTDTIFFSSFQGRRLGPGSKLAAGMLLITGIYTAVMALYTAAVLGLAGAGGAGTMIQVQFFGSDSFYNMTVWQEYIAIFMGGLLGSLFFGLFAMLISAGTGSPVLAVTIPFIFMLLPNFLANMDLTFLDKFLNLLPNQLLEVYRVISGDSLYELAGHVFGALPLLFLIYGCLCLGLIPAICLIYRRTVVQ